MIRNRKTKYHYLRIKVFNKSKEVIDLFHSTFQGSSVYQDKRNGVWEQALCGNSRVRKILVELLPSLIVEREHALVALDFDGKHSKLTGEDMEGREVIRGRISRLRLLPCKMVLFYINLYKIPL